MKKRYILIILLIAMLGLSACKRGKNSDQKTDDEAQPVTVETLSLKPLDDFITVHGKLEGISNVTMSSISSGRVLQLYKKLGDRVSIGERIGKMENEAYQYRLDQARAGLSSAQAAFDTAQRNKNYAEESRAKNLISQAEYNNAISAYEGAKAQLDGAKAGLEAARSSVDGSYFTAPEAGTITNLYIATGQFVAQGQPVATITNASSLVLRTGVGESQISKLRRGQKATISYPGKEPISAKVSGFGITPLPGSASYPLEIDLANPSGLLPGMVVTAKILTETHSDMLYSTITNFKAEFGKYYAYVVDKKNVAHKREVTLGKIIGEFAIIESGLKPGELIVTSGAENLEDGAKVQVRK